MAHELEIAANGEASMAYVGETPWHGLGFQVAPDLTPKEMMKAAKLNWTVNKVPLSYDYKGSTHETNRAALVRSTDGRLMDVISDGWEPCQNSEAFEFFHDFVEAGDMEMHTAGSLHNGRMVWALAKIKDGAFDAVKGDKVEGFMLFSNPHQYGRSIEVRQTNIRVVCNNTLTYALSKKTAGLVRLHHNKKFDPEMVKETMGLSKNNVALYKKQSKFLATKKCTPEQIHEYLNRLFPIGEGSKRPDREYTKPAQKVFDILETQPGHDFAPGTFWNLFNGVTYATDHIIGTSQSTRLNSAWFGRGQTKKIEALNLALEMAEAA
jgi:phage/plasmid-like protein (TIGR03299 family)